MDDTANRCSATFTSPTLILSAYRRQWWVHPATLALNVCACTPKVLLQTCCTLPKLCQWNRARAQTMPLASVFEQADQRNATRSRESEHDGSRVYHRSTAATRIYFE